MDYWMDMAKRVEDMGADSYMYQGYGRTFSSVQRQLSLVQALKECNFTPNRASYTLYIRCSFHDLHESSRSRMRHHRYRNVSICIGNIPAGNRGYGRSIQGYRIMIQDWIRQILAEIADYFRPMREEALESGLMNPKVLGVNIKTLLYQVPGGMLSNLISQLKEQGKEDKYEEVLAEVPRVRKDLGEPPLVTPSSQIVGTQAVFNVLMGERYKVATKETKDVLCRKIRTDCKTIQSGNRRQSTWRREEECNYLPSGRPLRA